MTRWDGAGRVAPEVDVMRLIVEAWERPTNWEEFGRQVGAILLRSGYGYHATGPKE